MRNGSIWELVGRASKGLASSPKVRPGQQLREEISPREQLWKEDHCPLRWPSCLIRRQSFLWFLKLSNSSVRKKHLSQFGVPNPAQCVNESSLSQAGVMNPMILLTKWMYQLHKVCANIYLHAESWRETSPSQNWKSGTWGVLSWGDWGGLEMSKWESWLVYTSEIPCALEMSCSEWCPCVLNSISLLRAGTPQHP